MVTDAVFSTTGRLAPLAALHEVARRAGAVLLVDEAHSSAWSGQAGRGAAAAAGLVGEPDVVITATLSKAFGSAGGVVLGSTAVRQHLDQHGAVVHLRHRPGPSVGRRRTRRAASHDAGARRRTATRQHGSLADALEVPRTDSAVVPVHVGDARAAAAARDLCLDPRGPRRLLPPAVGAAGPVVPAAHRTRRPHDGRHRPRGAGRAGVHGEDCWSSRASVRTSARPWSPPPSRALAPSVTVREAGPDRRRCRRARRPARGGPPGRAARPDRRAGPRTPIRSPPRLPPAGAGRRP